MKCPVCKNVELVVMVRKGIEIDYCPKCQGAWLEHGELDRIIIRSFPHALHVKEKHHTLPPLAHHELPPEEKKEARRSFLEDLFSPKG